MHNPLVSVLMTAYNRELYIAEAIQSVLNSTFKDFELIIVDDSSFDNTYAIAKSFNDPRITLIRNELNLGQFANRNKVANLASGKIFLYVDSDDTINPDAISHIVNLFNEYPESNFLTISRDNSYDLECSVGSEEIIRRHFFVKSSLHYGPGATAIRKDFYHEIGGFPLKYGPANDMFYNIKAACNTSVILCKNEFLNYRRHDNQELNNPFVYIHQGYNYFNDALDLPELPLTTNEKNILRLKNKRRFVTNLHLFLFKNWNIKLYFKAIKLANFKIVDFKKAIFLR